MKEKRYQVYRCGWSGKGMKRGTNHWFSKIVNLEEAVNIKEKWENINYQPTIEECEYPPNLTKIDKLEGVKIVEYKEPINYADGKIRKLTYNNKVYYYQTLNRETTIFDKNKNPIFKYIGDPHDRERNGVKTIIRNYRLFTRNN